MYAITHTFLQRRHTVTLPPPPDWAVVPFAVERESLYHSSKSDLLAAFEKVWCRVCARVCMCVFLSCVWCVFVRVSLCAFACLCVSLCSMCLPCLSM